MAAPSAAIYGCQGLALSPDEKAFLKDQNPLGFILFARNVENPDQVRALVDDFRASVGRADAPVLIDQEGGRVQRLRPPHWRDAPAGKIFADVAEVDLPRAEEAIKLNCRLIAAELMDLGINVDCAPVLDVPQAGAHDVIGDRALGSDPATVIALGRASADGFLAGGVQPIIKHIPGHGRALVDSHMELPRVDADRGTLEAIDFEPFKALADQPWAMTAHVVYEALDGDNPATTSKTMIDTIIRRQIGFDGLLVSDDLSMKALGGTFESRAERSLAAGCDVVLHCNGEMDEMTAVAKGVAPMTDAALDRYARAVEMAGMPDDFDTAEGLSRLNQLLDGAA